MKTLFSLKGSLTLFIILFFIIHSCSDDPVKSGPEDRTINGSVNFVDTNYVLVGGTYLISAFPSAGWPPMGPPAAFDTIRLTRNGNIFNTSYNYKLKDLNPGDYIVSVGFRKITGGASPVLSIYGCDTLRFIYSMCALSPTRKATIGPQNQGVEGINLISWADTTKKIFP